MAPYHYVLLDPASADIRLLVLRSGTWREAIDCDLIQVSLDTRPHYEALSYTWGNPTERRPILLGGHPHQVTVSLEIALRHIRSQTEDRTLWIDALCINQESLQERSEQVPRMLRIYISATQVLAWTGDASDGSDEAMAMLSKLGELLDLELENDLRASDKAENSDLEPSDGEHDQWDREADQQLGSDE